jgi:hypothetical protein
MKESAIAEAASLEMSEYRQSEWIQVRNVTAVTLASGAQKSLRAEIIKRSLRAANQR